MPIVWFRPRASLSFAAGQICMSGWPLGPFRFSTMLSTTGSRKWIHRQTMVRFRLCLARKSPPANLRRPGAGATLCDELISRPLNHNRAKTADRWTCLHLGPYHIAILAGKIWSPVSSHTLATKIVVRLVCLLTTSECDQPIQPSQPPRSPNTCSCS